MKSIDEEYEEITNEYNKKMESLKHRASQPMDPLVLTAWKAAIRRKLFIIWSLYALIVGGLIYFAFWIGDYRWNDGTYATLIFVTAPLTLGATALFYQTHKAIRTGAEKWWTILRYVFPKGCFSSSPMSSEDYDDDLRFRYRVHWNSTHPDDPI